MACLLGCPYHMTVRLARCPRARVPSFTNAASRHQGELCRRLPASAAVQLHLWVRIFACNRARPVGKSRGPSYELRDDGRVPVICPTCQIVLAGSRIPAAATLLCMGLFSIFQSGARPVP